MKALSDRTAPEAIGSGRMPRVCKGKLHLPDNVRMTERLLELAYGVDDSDHGVPDWHMAPKYRRYRYQSYKAYKESPFRR